MVKKTLSTIALVLLALVGNYFASDTSTDNVASKSQSASGAVAAAFASKRSDLVLEDVGTVMKILPDDNKGSRHQRFLVDLNGHSILIAHNIDLAPRIDSLREGTSIRFKGEYEYTAKGGVVHWTHHDPAGRHEGGFLEYQGRRYE